MHLWDGIISDDEEHAYRVGGFGKPVSMGQRPALVIIDVQYRAVGTQRKPFREAIEEFPTRCGDAGSRVSHAVNLFDMVEKYAHVMPAAEVIAHLPAGIARSAIA